MTSLGDVYLDVHANTKGLPGEVRRGAKKIGPEGDRAGSEFSKGFDRGFVRGRRRSGVFRSMFRLLTLPFRTAVSGFFNVGKSMAKVFSTAADGTSLLTTTFKALGVGALGVVTTLAKTGGALILLAALAVPLATVLVGATAAVTALAASLSFALVGAVGAAVAVIAPLIAAVGVLGLAFIGMSDKAKKAVKTAFKPLAAEFKELGKAARGPLLKAIPEFTKTLAGPLSRLKPLVRGISQAVADVGISFAQGMKTQGFKDFRDSMEKFLPFAVRRLGDIARQTLGGLGGLFRGMVPFMTDVLRNLDNITARFSKWANSASGQTSIQNFFKNVATSSKQVWGLLKAIGSLIGTVFSPGRVAGDNIIQSMTTNIRKFVDYLRANPQALSNFFQSGIAVARIMGQLFVGLMKMLGFLAINAAKAAQMIGKILIALSFVPGPQSGFLRSMGEGLKNLGADAEAMAAQIESAITSIEQLGNTSATPKLHYESFRTGAARLKAEGRTVAQVMQSVEGPYTPVINPPKVEKVKAITKDLISSLSNLPFFGKSIKPIKVPWSFGSLTGKVPWKGTAAAAKAIVNWKWGKAPKFPKVTGNKVKIDVSGAGAFDSAKRKANQLTEALKKADKADPNIKIKDNASTAKDHIGSVKSALSRLDGKTSHVYIVTHKRTVGGGYMGGPAMSAASFARGGRLPGASPGDPTVDNLMGFAGSRRTPIMLRSGEFIMNEPATKMFQPLLEAMNRAGNKKVGLASGGMALPGKANGGPAPIVNVDPSTMTDPQMRQLAEYIGEAIARRMRGRPQNDNIRLKALGAN